LKKKKKRSEKHRSGKGERGVTRRKKREEKEREAAFVSAGRKSWKGFIQEGGGIVFPGGGKGVYPQSKKR